MNARLLLACSATVMLSACAYFGEPTMAFRPVQPPEVGEADRGRELYLRDCAWCHGANGEGTDVGPDLFGGMNSPALTHFTLTTGRMPLDYPEQRMTHRDPVYTQEEMLDIVEYVESLGQEGPDIPVVDLEGADLALGLELYQANCAACHSTTGIGGAMAPSEPQELPEREVERASTIAPDLSRSTPTEVAEAILTGPGTMPVFAPGTFSSEELDAIVAYVDYLEDPVDRGGASIGGIGPVAEGFYGWVVGLGALLVLIRWLGTKAGE